MDVANDEAPHLSLLVCALFSSTIAELGGEGERKEKSWPNTLFFCFEGPVNEEEKTKKQILDKLLTTATERYR